MIAFLISWTMVLFLLAFVWVMSGSGIAVLVIFLAVLPYFAALVLR
jgi:hypothetical protein